MSRRRTSRVGRLFSAIVSRDFYRSRLAVWALALGAASPRLSLATDNWINPSGGNWTDGTNWSTGAQPVSGDVANFSLNSSGYTVTGGRNEIGINVQNDQVTLNGLTATDTTAVPGLAVTSTTGQTTSLTMENGSFVTTGPGATVGGTGGTTSLTLNQFTINDYTSVQIGGSGSSVTNFTETGGEIRSRTDLQFGNGTGSVNVNISGGTLSSDYPISFGPLGTVTALLSSTTINNSAFVVGSGTGNATVTANASTFTVAGDLAVGASNFFTGYPTSLPATGGGTGKLTLSNSSSSATVLLVGDSGGNGTFIGTGSGTTFSSNLDVVVGDYGTGVVNFNNGANVSSSGMAIGGDGGNGTVTLSGNTTVMNLPGSNVSIGSFAGSVGTGLLELDSKASLTLHYGTIPQQGVTPGYVVGNLSVSSSGTMQVLSGARASGYQLVETAGSTLEFGLDGPTVAANGQIDLTGQATLGGTLDVVLENGFQPMVGEQFQLLSFVGESGQFSTLNLPSLYSWDTSALYTQGVITVTAVPEPASLGFAFVAAVAVLGQKKRKS